MLKYAEDMRFQKAEQKSTNMVEQLQIEGTDRK